MGEFVVCVGSTGAGKSSTVCLLSGDGKNSGVLVGDGANPVTGKCLTVRNGLMEGIALVDTPGWSDLNRPDRSNFANILRFLKDEGLTRLRAVVWNVTPEIRITREMCNQASFINQLCPGEVWPRTLLLCKEARNPEEQTAGAKEAIRRIRNDDNNAVKVVGFTYLHSAKSLSQEQKDFAKANPAMRRLYHLYDEKDAREVIMEALTVIMESTEAVDIHFEDRVCVACGERGDPRIMSRFCHLSKGRRHPGRIELFHPHSQPTKQHPGKAVLMTIHPSLELYFPLIVKLACATNRKKRHKCCGKKVGSEGCREVRAHVCCKREEGTSEGCSVLHKCCMGEAFGPGCQQRMSCCRKQLIGHEEQGCEDFCQKCGRRWGSQAKGCFEKEHHLEEKEETAAD